VQSCCLKAIKQGLISSAHDCANGGLAITLAESCLRRGLGFKSEKWQFGGRLDATLFGEVQSRIVVSVDQDKVRQLQALAKGQGIPLTRLGTVGGRRFTIDRYIDLPLDEMEAAWRQSLEKMLS